MMHSEDITADNITEKFKGMNGYSLHRGLENVVLKVKLQQF